MGRFKQLSPYGRQFAGNRRNGRRHSCRRKISDNEIKFKFPACKRGIFLPVLFYRKFYVVVKLLIFGSFVLPFLHVLFASLEVVVATRHVARFAVLHFCKQFFLFFFGHLKTSQYSQLPTVLGKGITSRIFEIPVRYITIRSNPRPYPE